MVISRSWKPLSNALSLALLLATCLSPAQTPGKPPLIAIHKPTIIAFSPITQAQADSGQDSSEALGDFNFYVLDIEKRLQVAGIDIQVVNDPSFGVQSGAKVSDFPNPKARAGYYFIAPGKKTHIEYGVMTGEDILDVAQKYFGIAIPREKCRGAHCAN